MKLRQIFEETLLKLKIDNPGSTWLANKREYSDEDGKNQHGARKNPGVVTATWGRRVLIPVDVAAKVPGLCGEQKSVRKDDFEAIKDIMSTTKRLPLFKQHDGKFQQYVPFIIVTQDGEAWVNEGNHRIMVAKHLGWKYIPVEIRYFNGGERESGPLSPNKIREYDTAGLEEGYDPDEFEHKP